MQKIFFVGIMLFIFPLAVFAEGEVVISSGTNDIENFVFTGLPGSVQQGVIIIENTTQENQEVSLYIASEEGLSLEQAEARDNNFLFGKMRFYPNNPPEDYLEAYEDNNRNIVALCERRDENSELDTWCDGQKVGVVALDSEESARIAYVVHFDQDVQKGESYMTAKIESEKRTYTRSQVLAYDPPIKKVRRLIIKKLSMKRAFDATDIIAWANNNFHEAYNVEAVVESQSNEDVDYTLRLAVDPVRFGTMAIYDQERTISENQSEDHFYDMVGMPRFGSVVINGQLTYIGDNGEEVLFETEDARIFLFPMKELIILSAIIGVIFIARGVIMRRKKGIDTNAALTQQEDLYHENFMDGKQSQGPKEKIAQEPMHNKQESAATVVAEKAAMKRAEMHEEISVGTDVDVNNSTQQDVSDALDEQGGQEVDVVQKEQGESLKNSVTTQTQGNISQKVTPRNSLKSLDIEWIREDSKDFEDAMRIQEKKMNMKVAAFAMVFFGVFGVIIFLIISRDVFLMAPKTTITLDDVSADQQQEEVAEAQEVVVESEENTVEEENESEVDEVVESEDVAPENITVQVLNGGGAPGAAGALTQNFKDGSYKTQQAANAKNDYSGVYVYHKEGEQKTAETVAAYMKESYPDVTYEVSDAVVEAYDADVVVVLGS